MNKDKKNTTPRDRRGQELKAIVRFVEAQASGRVIVFEVIVAHRCVIVTRGADGQYRYALTTDFDRCGERTRTLSVSAAIAEAKAHYDEKRFILGKEDTYGDLKIDQTEKFYLVELWSGHTPSQHYGPYCSEAEYAAAARAIYKELEEGSVLLIARTSAVKGFELMSFRAGFFEEEDKEEGKDAVAA